VRRFAALALANIGGEEAAETLLRVISNTQQSRILAGATNALAVALETAPEGLLDECLDAVAGATERCFALRALGRRGSRRHLGVVEAGLVDSDPATRAHAVLAFARLTGSESSSVISRAHAEAGSVMERIAADIALVSVGDSANDLVLARLREDLLLDSHMYKRPLRDDIVEVLESSTWPGAVGLGHAWRVMYQGGAGRLLDF
jgi:HEAT repeat protein